MKLPSPVSQLSLESVVILSDKYLTSCVAAKEPEKKKERVHGDETADQEMVVDVS